MAGIKDSAAWQKMASDEATALAALLQRDGRKVMVVVVEATGDKGIRVAYSATPDPKPGHLKQFAEGLMTVATQVLGMFKVMGDG